MTYSVYEHVPITPTHTIAPGGLDHIRPVIETVTIASPTAA
jgi:hypothetical protein